MYTNDGRKLDHLGDLACELHGAACTLSTITSMIRLNTEKIVCRSSPSAETLESAIFAVLLQLDRISGDLDTAERELCDERKNSTFIQH